MIIEIDSFLGEAGSEYKMVLDIRNKVFVEEQNVSAFEEFDAFDLTSFHFIVKIDGVACGTARYRETSEGFKFERFALLREHRGLGLGYLLIKHMLNEVKLAKKIIYLHAQVHLKTFYGNVGFVAVGEVFVEAGIVHVKMIYKK